MSDVAKAVKPLFDKFIDFFDIFDLSFFVSGATFVAAIAWADLTPDLAELIGFTGGTFVGEVSGVGAVMLILASYVAGMTCFAVGRFVRKWGNRGKDRLFGGQSVGRSLLLDELAQHGVVEPDGDGYRVSVYGERIPWLSRYLVDGGEGRLDALYVRMWAEVRQRERFAPSFSLLRRYWVSAATLDGLFVAFSTWAVLLGLIDVPEHGWFPSVATLIGAAFCLREAQRYGVYQREELVATMLHGYDLPDDELEHMMGRVPDVPPPSPATPAVTQPTPSPAAEVETGADTEADTDVSGA